MAKIFLQLGYKCFLTIYERSSIQNPIKERICKLTALSKSTSSKRRRTMYNRRKRELARIMSKMEHLFPEEGI